MRRIVSLFLLATLVVSLGSVAMAADAKKDRGIDLFNGKDLKGWSHFLVDKDVKMEDVWSVKDGLLVCKGEPVGYIQSDKEFKNFKLVVVWRWAPGSKGGNNGILLRITGESQSFLPKCCECQLKTGSAGDLYGFYGYKITGPEGRLKVSQAGALGTINAVPKLEMVEKKPGQWNRAEVTATDGTITVKINGKDVNKATGCELLKGKIGLQSEGGEIHFRRVRIIPLDKE